MKSNHKYKIYSIMISVIPSRYIIALMIFTGNCISYTMRVNLSVNLVAMVPVGSNLTNTEDNLNWSVYERAQVLGGYQWGYFVSSIIGGTSAERWGPRVVIAISTVITILLTVLSPLAAHHSFVSMLVVRIILGFFGGYLYPSMHALISKWSVPNEKGTFMGVLIAGTIGVVVAWSLCGLLIVNFGWEWGFYTFGILGAFWVVLWWFLVYDSPTQHPWIAPSEKKYLSDSIIESESNKAMPPYGKIFLSVPVWSLFIITFGTGWGIYFIITAAPNYIANVLGYKISSTGFLAGSLYLSRCSCALIFGYVGDLLLKSKRISLNVLRKVGCILAFVLPACLLFAMTHPQIRPSTSIALLILTMGLNGAVTISATANGHDLTKNFAGTLIGIANAFGTLGGIITPFVTAYFTQYDETSAEAWRAVFYTGASVYLFTGVQFLVLGSTTTQPWNDIIIAEHKVVEENTIA